MIDSLKKLDKKFLIIAGMIIFIPILIIVALVIIQGCSNRKMTYEQYEKKMIEAAQKYVNNSDKVPSVEGEVLTIKLSTLVKKEYIKSTEEAIGDTTCKGNVVVRRNGSSVETTNGGFLNYIVNLDCDKYSTINLVDKIKENVVTEGSGLYQNGEGYIFKGDKVNNYITFFGHNYRIVSIDKEGILKLIKSEAEFNDIIWDNKYNIETNRNSGHNIYKDGIILNYLLEDYKNTKKINTKAKEHIVAYDTCVGKRNNTDYSINNSTDCSEKLEKQVISLLNISDYAQASLDVNCVNLRSRSCNNYNYLYGVVSSTWTSNASLNNTYEVIYLSDGLMEVQNANTYNSYNIVIYMDGNELYTKGIGSVNDPYVYE